MNGQPDFEKLLDAAIGPAIDPGAFNPERAAVVAAHHEACLRAAEDAHAAAMRACAAELAVLKTERDGLLENRAGWFAHHAAELAAERQRAEGYRLLIVGRSLPHTNHDREADCAACNAMAEMTRIALEQPR